MQLSHRYCEAANQPIIAIGSAESGDMTYNPVAMTMSYRAQKLHHQRLDLGLEKGMWHRFQQGLEVMFDERHHNEDPVDGVLCARPFQAKRGRGESRVNRVM